MVHHFLRWVVQADRRGEMYRGRRVRPFVGWARAGCLMTRRAGGAPVGSGLEVDIRFVQGDGTRSTRLSNLYRTRQ